MTPASASHQQQVANLRRQIATLRAELDALDEHACMLEQPSSREGFADFARRVALAHGTTMTDIRGNGRRMQAVTARMELYWTGSVIHGLSLPVIGRIMHRDHSSVFHGRRQVDAIFATAFGGRAEALARTETERRAAIVADYTARSGEHVARLKAIARTCEAQSSGQTMGRVG